MTIFAKHVTYRVEADGRIERSEGHMPAVLKLPPVSVTMPVWADPRETARLLRRLADELEARS